ncbi:cytidine deaminase [Flavobacterium sp. F372]|jgi:cytidine deaminase|uniref:Cytidine deaminase n=1 Tax=Flavobacterium bernardetii TaxID=2813823 RepID=A0ABR7IU73_9FLAO|nr:cytidine deaminase [Flavobacterium bernardetii]MBC5833273.1 cytidine deaminase [Flavobacterium bernardetii]NHF68505.1 cytidine deaminase [Flavobacterium bernardetii]
MKEIQIETKLSVFESFDELSQSEKEYMNQAIEIRKKAYAPYSKFQVGAAIVLDNGMVLQGSNQENAAYPSGLCAERVVIFYAGANYPNNKIVKLFITATPSDRDSENPIPPCGSCRQSIAEYEIKQDLPIEIYFMGAKGEVYKSDSLKNLLPFMFDKSNL